jgi:hypothetical protein
MDHFCKTPISALPPSPSLLFNVYWVKNEWSYTSIPLSYFLQKLSAAETNPNAQHNVHSDKKVPVHLWKKGEALCWEWVRQCVEIPCQVILVHLQVQSLPHLQDKIPWYPFVHRDLYSKPYDTYDKCTPTFQSPCIRSRLTRSWTSVLTKF